MNDRRCVHLFDKLLCCDYSLECFLLLLTFSPAFYSRIHVLYAP